MKHKKQELILHSIMCTIGGFLGGYVLFCRIDNFGSSQTSNMVEIILSIIGRDYIELLLRLLGLALYVSAIIICVILKNKTNINVRAYSIVIDFIGLVILAFIPLNINPIIGLLPAFFIMATQWTVFHGVGEYNSSTIFSTNNLKQCTIAFTKYRLNKEKEMLDKGKFFGNSLIWYHIGAIVGGLSGVFLSVKGSIVCIPIVFLAFGVNMNLSTIKKNKKVAPANIVIGQVQK